MRAIDTDATSTQTRAVSEAPSPWLALRVILTVAAAVLLLVGSFLEWANGIDGSELAVQSYWSTDAGTAGFFSSAGLVTAIIAAASARLSALERARRWPKPSTRWTDAPRP